MGISELERRFQLNAYYSRAAVQVGKRHGECGLCRNNPRLVRPKMKEGQALRGTTSEVDPWFAFVELSRHFLGPPQNDLGTTKSEKVRRTFMQAQAGVRLARFSPGVSRLQLFCNRLPATKRTGPPCPVPIRRPSTVVRHEIEIEPGAVLEFQAAFYAIFPPANDRQRSGKAQHFELVLQLVGVPHLTVLLL